jgi:hypothetical protein
MTAAPRILIVPLGLSLGMLFVMTYVLCVLFGLMVSDQGMHLLFPMLLPGFTWLTWPSFLLGLIESFASGWYVALIFGPPFNFLSARSW